jgi:hypothetical protein
MKKVKLKLNKIVSLKLQFVKTIKDYTGLGLREAKFVVDDLHADMSKSVEITISNNKNVDDLIKEIKLYLKDEVSVNGGLEFQRNHNLLSLGIGEKEDYIEHILEWSNIQNDEKFFRKVLEHVSKENLEKLVGEIKVLS